MQEAVIINVLVLGLSAVTLGAVVVVALKLRDRFSLLDKQFAQLAGDVERVIRRNGSETALEIQNAISISALPFKYPVFLGEASIDAFHARTLMCETLAVRPKTVLEFGSGSSSTLIALALCALGDKGIAHYSVDHSEYYLNLSRDLAEANGVSGSINFCLCPLEKINGYTHPWYSGVRDLVIGRKIDLMVVDGPPAYKPETRGARAPALPELVDLLAPECAVIVDDANRIEEAQMIDGWARDYPEFQVTRYAAGKGVAILRRRSEQ